MRIPDWVTPAAVQGQVNGTPRAVTFAGRYAQLGAVKPGDTATITFPIAERTDVIWIEKRKYTIVRKGYDVVEIDPPGQLRPLYQRAHYRAGVTRWLTVRRFVSSEKFYW